MPVTGFDYDVFISYAGVNDSDERDDFGANAPERGWVKLFQARLTEKINGMHDEPVRVWFDRSAILRGEAYSPVIEDGAKRSAVMVSLLSAPYLRRPFCKQEVAWFFEQDPTHFPFLIDNYCRLIPVWLHDMTDRARELDVFLRPADAPDREYQREPFKVYRQDESRVSHRFRYNSPEYRDDYEETLRQIATRISMLLHSMQRRAPTYASIVSRAQPRFPGAKHVFLDAVIPAQNSSQAPTTAPQSVELRQRLRSALEQKKINVLDLVRPTNVGDGDYDLALEAALKKACVAVHIVDMDQSTQFSDTGFQQIKRSLELAERCAESGEEMRRFVWISDRTLNANTLPAEQRTYIDGLRNSQSKGVHVVRSDLRTLQAEIESALGIGREMWQRSGKLATAYISYQKKNERHANDVRERLKELNVGVIFHIAFPTGDVPNKATLNVHRSKMRTCDGFVVVYSGDTDQDLGFLHKYCIDLAYSLRSSGKAPLRSTLIYEPSPPPGVNVDPGIDAPDWPIAQGRQDGKIDLLAASIQGAQHA